MWIFSAVIMIASEREKYLLARDINSINEPTCWCYTPKFNAKLLYQGVNELIVMIRRWSEDKLNYIY